MAITNARILIRRGLEADFNPDGLQPGEWALSVDRGNEILRVCVSPGEFIRIATYESFEKDMAQIEAILAECNTIEEAVKAIQEEINAKEVVFESYVQQAKGYSETAAAEASKATTEADRAESEADRAKQYRDEAEQFRNEAEAIVGVDVCQITSEITLNRQTLGYTKKNLLKNTATTQTVNSVTFTVNEDGSVTVNGTATNAINIEISKHLQVDLLEDNIDYVLSGGSANAKIFMNLRDSNDVYIKTITQQSGSGFVFNKILLLETEGCSLYNLGIYVPNGSTHTNTTIYPMIRHASITDATYEPYVDDVDTRLKSLERESGGSGGTAGTTDYEDLSNKPSVNGVELSGNKTTSDLGITAESVGADAAGSASTALSNAKDYTDTKIADLVSGAPSTLDTLKEISDALAESGEAIEAINQAIGNKLDKNGDSKDNTVTFTQASTRENIASTEKHSTLFGKIAKWFADLKTVAFSGSYNDLSNKPAIPTKTSELENDSGFMGSATALDTYEEIMANTESGKFAGAKGVKEGFSAINDSLGGLRFGIDGDGNYGYYGADDSLIPFKSSKVIAILCRNSVANHTFAKGTPFNDLEYCTAVNSDADTVTKTVTFNKSCKVLLLHTLTAINNDHDSAVTITLNNEEIFTDSVSATTINSYKQIEFTTEVGDVLEIKYKSTNLAYIAGQAILLV